VQLIRIANLAPPSYVEGGICDYSANPCSKRLIRPEPGKRLVRVQKTFLNGVLRVLSRERDCSSYRECAYLMPTHELRKRLAAPPLSFDNERTLVVSARAFRRRRSVV